MCRAQVITRAGNQLKQERRSMETEGPAAPLPVAGLLAPGATPADGRYRVEGQVGAWGMRALYRVREAATGRVALLAELAAPALAAGRTAVHPPSDLRHPILPAMLDSWQQGGLLYLVIDVANGATLDQALAQQPAGIVDAEQAVVWGIALCEGLAFLHGRGLVVADLAPPAVLVAPDGALTLLGLGNLLGLYTAASLVAALEQGYAAPEVYLGRATPAGDIYALGALLHRALSGADLMIYAPGSLPSLALLRPDLPPPLAAAVARAVALDPEDRWPSASTFAAALGRALSAEARALAVVIPPAVATTPREPVAEVAPGAGSAEAPRLVGPAVPE
jgi:serine/threonine-protein kinase